MTAPGLRGFVLEVGPGDEENLLSAALAALAAAFTVTAEPAAPGTGPRRRTWLDTFDWRLYRGGLILQFEQARRGGRLLLSQADGTPQAEQAVTSWPRRPPLDLPDGPVRDRIIVLTRPRALLPIVRAVSTARVTRLLNADGKTVARLVADHVTVTAPSQPAAGHAALSQPATTAELAPRLAVTEVRGYPGQARKASALLAAVPGVAPASQGTFLAALTALGRHPADYSSSVAAQITAELPAPVAVARLLLRLLDTLESNVDGVLRDIDSEFLHDLRVAVRRTRSAIKLLGAVLPDKLAEHYQAEFKWLGDVTTPVRDLDVHLLGFDAMASGVEAASPADLEPLRAFLARRRALEVRRLAAALRGPRFRAIADDWRKALLELRDDGGPRRRRPTARTLALSTTGRAFRRIAARGAAITPASPPESLHDLRKRAKELRYLLEFFAPVHDPVAYRKVVGDLKQLQDCLGDFQDSEVQRDEISSLAEAMLAERAAPAATLLAMGEIAAKLARSQLQARDEFAARFARFAGPAGQERVRVLLEGAREDLRHLQHQGRRREDDGGRQPGLPVRRRRPPHPALGPGPAGRGQLPVPDQAAGQGRRQGPHPRHQGPGRRDQGHRLRRPRPDPGRLHLPQHGPAAGRGGQEADQENRPAAAPAGRRVRPRVPRLPAEHLAGLGERHTRGRRAGGPADPHHALGPDAGPAHRVRGRLQRPPSADTRVLLHG